MINGYLGTLGCGHETWLPLRDAGSWRGKWTSCVTSPCQGQREIVSVRETELGNPLERNIHVIGIDPGGTTGWCRITIPRASVFDGARSEILSWETGEITGTEPEQVRKIGWLARSAQGLAYKTGPALVVEDWTIEPMARTTDPASLSPIRIGAMLVYAGERHELGDSSVTFQDRALAKGTCTDERLKEWGMWPKGSSHERDATRHAITALRRAKRSAEFRSALWPARLPGMIRTGWPGMIRTGWPGMVRGEIPRQDKDSVRMKHPAIPEMSPLRFP